jgi:hypothetical protein
MPPNPSLTPEDAALHDHVRRADHHGKIKSLLEQGAAIDGTDEHGRTALMISTYNKDVRNSLALLRQGARIDATDEDGNTALHWAGYHKNYEMIRTLVRKGAPLEAANRKGETPAAAVIRMMHDCQTRSVAPITPQEAQDFQKAIAVLNGAKADKLAKPFTKGTASAIAVRKPLRLKPR